MQYGLNVSAAGKCESPHSSHSGAVAAICCLVIVRPHSRPSAPQIESFVITIVYRELCNLKRTKPGSRFSLSGLWVNEADCDMINLCS